RFVIMPRVPPGFSNDNQSAHCCAGFTKCSIASLQQIKSYCCCNTVLSAAKYGSQTAIVCPASVNIFASKGPGPQPKSRPDKPDEGNTCNRGPASRCRKLR